MHSVPHGAGVLGRRSVIIVVFHTFHFHIVALHRDGSPVDPRQRRVSAVEVCHRQPDSWYDKLVSFMTFIKSYYLMSVASDESGDGNGAFYLPGGELMPQNVLDECLEFSEKVCRYSFLSSQ